MFRFAHSEYLFLLLLIPILVFAFIYHAHRKRKALAAFGNPKLLKNLMPNASFVKPQVKFYIQITALILLIFALAQPQFGTKEQTIKRNGIEIMVALDISNSMLTADVQPNRLDRAKLILTKLIDKMSNDKIGLVVFAGDAYTQLPITCDYVSAKMFMSTITPSLIPRQGTAIGTALDMSIKSFGGESDASRAIILITDGENHEDDAVEAAKLAQSKGIHVYVIGMGKPEGGPIPIPKTMSFHKDKAGNVVVSKLNEEMCQQIAQAGAGVYVRADNTNNALRVLSSELDKLAKTEIETKVYADYNEQYQSFVLLTLLLLLIDFFILNRKNKRLSKINLFDTVAMPTKKNKNHN